MKNLNEIKKQVENDLEWTRKDKKDWKKFKQNLPKVIIEATIFGIFSIMFLGGIAFIILKFLEALYNL
jgi:hypothetical protein|tara:strand:- start:566 stop:769 length:204 start_codon:yes stop_codon:yes gene_type:complete